jgi:hypothetical protein
MRLVAVHESAYGTKRTNRRKIVMSALRGKADMGRCTVPIISAASDPKRTSRGLKSRSAAVSWCIVCAIVWMAAPEGRHAPQIQNNSGLSQGLGGPSAAG